MSLGLQAPAAVPVEISAAGRRVFRLSRAIGEQGVELARPLPPRFAPDEPVDLRFALPGSSERLALRARPLAPAPPSDMAARQRAPEIVDLEFIASSLELRRAQQAISAYVVDRLGLHKGVAPKGRR